MTNSGSGTVSVISVRASSSTSLSCSQSSVSGGSSAVCTATVKGVSPSGTVAFAQSGTGSITLPIAACTLSSSGQCQITVIGKTAGSVNLDATYRGDSNNLASSGSFVITVNGITVVDCTNSSPVVGSSTTCEATVTGSSPTGVVTWTGNGSGRFSAHTCKLSKGACSVRFTPTSAGSPVTITASYSGNKHNPPSVGTLLLAITLKTSKTTVSCKPTSAVAGSSTIIKCTAKVTGYFPVGTVVWSSMGTGTVSLPSGATCTLTKGSCFVTFSGTSSGLVTIRAAYGGDHNNTTSLGTRNVTVK